MAVSLPGHSRSPSTATAALVNQLQTDFARAPPSAGVPFATLQFPRPTTSTIDSVDCVDLVKWRVEFQAELRAAGATGGFAMTPRRVAVGSGGVSGAGAVKLPACPTPRGVSDSAALGSMPTPRSSAARRAQGSTWSGGSSGTPWGRTPRRLYGRGPVAEAEATWPMAGGCLDGLAEAAMAADAGASLANAGVRAYLVGAGGHDNAQTSSSSWATAPGRLLPPIADGGAVPPTQMPPSPARPPPPPTAAKSAFPLENQIEYSEAVHFNLDPILQSICRGNIPLAMAARETCEKEFAKMTRQRHNEAGLEHRRRGFNWRIRKEKLQKSRQPAPPPRGKQGGGQQSARVRRLGSKKRVATDDATDDAETIVAAAPEATVSYSDAGDGSEANPSESTTKAMDASLDTAIETAGAGAPLEPIGEEQPGEQVEGSATVSDGTKERSVLKRQKSLKVKSLMKAHLGERVAMRGKEVKKVWRRDTKRKQVVSELDAGEREELQNAFDLYAVKQKGCDDRLLPHNDMLRCLHELGLAGNTGNERAAIEHLCSEIYSALQSEKEDGLGHQNSIEAKQSDKRRSAVTQLDVMNQLQQLDPGFNKAVPTSLVQEEIWAESGKKNGFMRYDSKESAEDIFGIALFVSFEDFCSEIVPVSRGLLEECREDFMLQAFMKGIGIGVGATLEVVYGMAEKFYIEVSYLSTALTEASLPLLNLKATPNRLPDPDDAKVQLDFEVVKKVIAKSFELMFRERRRQERSIMAEMKMPKPVFHHYRQELVNLKAMYGLFDADHSLSLGRTEVMMLLKQIGMQPYHAENSKMIERIWKVGDKDGDGEVSFLEFLAMMDQMRKEMQKTRKHSLIKIYKKHTAGRDNLDMKDIPAAVLDHGLKMVTVQDQESLNMTIEESDAGARGVVTFVEFEDIYQRLVESVFSRQGAAIREHAARLNMDLDTIGQYIVAYDQLDADGSGSLDLDEVGKALTLLIDREPSEEELAILYKGIGVGKKSELDSVDFLRLVESAQKTGLLPKEPAFMIREMNHLKIREMLSFWPLSDTYIRDLHLDDLLELASEYLELDADADLREGEGLPDGVTIGCLRQMREYAQQKAETDAAAEEPPSSA